MAEYKRVYAVTKPSGPAINTYDTFSMQAKPSAAGAPQATPSKGR
jgi:hypothetical protein